MGHHHIDCRLCNALRNPFTSGEIRPCDTVLFKGTKFVLLPAIGPLVRGHAMLVSRNHYPSLAAMPDEAIREYEGMIQNFFRLPRISGNLLEAEHGSTADCHAGACVAHTHIHLMPGFAEHRDILDGSLPNAGTLSDLTSIQRIKHPYIYLRANLGEVAVFDSTSVPTQAIRRSLCGRLGQANWDWRTDPRDDLIHETIAFWKAALADDRLV